MSADDQLPDADSQLEDDDRRFDTRVSVTLWVDQEHGQERSFCHAADISSGGLRFDCGLPHAVGAVVQLRFNLPDEDEPFEVQAEIVGATWQDNRPSTNLRFVELSGEDHIRITRFVERFSGSGD